jgi:hypothetical protein
MRERIREWIEAAKSNERRWMATQELKQIAESTHPWTVEALHAAVRRWLDGEEPK